LNTAFLKLGARNPDQAELELLMRRKEFLDEVHQVKNFPSILSEKIRKQGDYILFSFGVQNLPGIIKM
jgi:hypothetical protein